MARVFVRELLQRRLKQRWRRRRSIKTATPVAGHAGGVHVLSVAQREALRALADAGCADETADGPSPWTPMDAVKAASAAPATAPLVRILGTGNSRSRIGPAIPGGSESGQACGAVRAHLRSHNVVLRPAAPRCHACRR
eukprot:COSAG06_NODE_5036_length_3770_cov_13.868973_1_plen_139_part_00